MDDPFGALDDSAFENVDASTSRQDRIQAAFEQSKLSYHPSRELIVVEPGWFSAVDDSARAATMSAKMVLKTPDYELSSLYARAEYRRALDLALAELEQTDPESKEYCRALLDTGMRCCVKLRDAEIGLRLVELSRDKWATAPSLASSAAEVLLMSGRTTDAIAVNLSVLEYRGALRPFLTALRTSLQKLQEQCPSSASREAIEHVLQYMQVRMLRQRPFPFLSHVRPPESSTTLPDVDADTLLGWCRSCGLAAPDAQRLFNVLALAKPAEDDVAEAKPAKSVREL